MPISYTNNAWATLTTLVNFIEEKNTEGAGIRWFKRYEQFIEKALINAEQVRLCNNVTF